MTPTDLRAALQRLNFSQVDLKHLTGKDAVTVNRWARGRLPVPVYVETILKLTEAHGVVEARRILENRK